MEKICRNINKRHRNAQFAGRASIEYYVGQVLKNEKEGTTHEGFIVKVFSNGVVILVPKFGVESLIHLRDLGDEETAVFDEENFSLKVKTEAGTTRLLSIFDKINVSISSIKDESSGMRKVRMSLAN